MDRSGEDRCLRERNDGLCLGGQVQGHDRERLSDAAEQQGKQQAFGKFRWKIVRTKFHPRSCARLSFRSLRRKSIPARILPLYVRSSIQACPAYWYKQRLKDSILSKLYSDKNKVTGVDIEKDKNRSPADLQPLSRCLQERLQTETAALRFRHSNDCSAKIFFRWQRYRLGKAECRDQAGREFLRRSGHYGQCV